MTEITDDVEAIVEDTDLPRRLKDEVYETLESRSGVAPEDVEDIVQAVESQYLETRVDPLDPVGTVSAQSIGEPGTQMSIPADEQVVVRRNGETELTEIGPLVDSLMDSRETRSFDDHEVTLAPDGIEVPSLSSEETVEWKPIEEVSRHETPDELLRFELESGRSIRATKAHSFVTRQENEVVPVAGEELEAGDWLPVVASLDATDTQETVDLRKYLPAGDYWYTSVLADGGAEAVPGGPDQLRNKRAALEAGELAEHTAYPVQGTVGLPEQFPLDEETGFFVGAWLAEGSLADHYVSISNVDAAFQSRIRSFAERFDLTVNEYENDSGFAAGYDIRLNGTILSDFLRAACTDDGEKSIPGFAIGANEAFLKGLLQGYFSGDGNVGTNAIRSSSTSDRLTAGVGLLLARFDVYATLGQQEDSRTLRVPKKHVSRFDNRIGMVGERGAELEALAESADSDGPDATDQIPNFGDALEAVAEAADIPQRQVNSATKRQRIDRSRLARLVAAAEAELDGEQSELDALRQAVTGDVVWDRIESIETVESDHEYVYDVSVEGLETFTTADGVVTHNTMNTFHYAGVAEIDVTQGLPRLIELVDARKTPDTPMMTVHLEGEYARDRERAHEVVWKIEATKILALGDVSTNVADMLVQIDLNEETLAERWPTMESIDDIAGRIAGTIEGELGVDTARPKPTVIEFGPEEPSYRQLLQLVEELREIVFKGIEEINRVVIRKEETEQGEEFVLYTEGSDLKEVLDIEGVDASRTTCNNIHEIHNNLGIEAAREAIIEETMNTLEEQGLDDVNIRHLMLVADIMTNNGEIESIGRHGISGNKDSVLARAAFEVTVNHLLDAAIHGEVDDLDGVTENVIVGKPIKLGTGDVDLRMGATRDSGSRADD
ncbi:DNA-directed RNA polymerase subunit A'' (intein-containing) [Natronomonas pharaonis DSM 2160]|uniref:DNA-directed RNA polymerase subunit Rpo1C n=1 Tax=Natronomonas pharaonis (strain ATCC 35678 / DSM 2160 / CIP 103997 / JCM 8858 / NBRC 14720 / NCIMB 2260 / Gabara) TaxID=348780 RepID=A0A1U7ETD5_NATPD|nr:DNA-directed RNA polymerase subunit A'' [Natronomonas pharaonis]CAI48149.1 DNA-directed RNA polymerase subunit A'' (intein-containing) [Natronomonas pharaonis DSM 2160]